MVNFLTNKERKLTLKNTFRKRARNLGEINKLRPRDAFNIKKSRKNLNKITSKTQFNNKANKSNKSNNSNDSILNTATATYLKDLTTLSSKLPDFKKTKKVNNNY